jgi:cytoskeletal protein CcmA (bactofilin family)
MSQVSVIAEGTIVRGSVEGEGSLELLGRVEGDVVMSGDVTVGEAAQVLGSISGGKISVHGAVQGDLRGREAVLLEPGARVVGDLSAPRIGVAGGALVRGNVRTEGETTSPRRPMPVTAAAAPKPLAQKPLPVAFAPKPVAKAEQKPLPLPLPAPPPPHRLVNEDEGDEIDSAREDDVEQVRAVAAARAPERPADRRPPPPVLPSLGKGAKGKKKGRD